MAVDGGQLVGGEVEPLEGGEVVVELLDAAGPDERGRDEAAVALCDNPDPASVEGTAPFTTPGGVEVTSILLEPIPITQDNLDVVVDAGWIDEGALCAGVPAGTVEACG